MNRETSVTNILLCLTTALSAVAVLVWMLAPALAATSLGLRVLVVIVLLAAVVPALATFIQQRVRNERLARTILDDLSRCDASTLCVEEQLECTLRAPPRHPWQPILARLREVLSEQGLRLADAEQARARAEIRSQRLAIERRQFAEILAGLSDPVLAIDQYDELVLANPSAELALGFEAQSTDKRALATLVHCEQLVELLRDTRRRKAPTTRTSELTLYDEDGREHSYRVTCRSLTCDANDETRQTPHGAVAVLHDIAQIKAIQKRNAEFVSSVSHEMKAPLSGIKAYVELLADGDAEDEATREEFLGVISSQADRLQRLVENLLNLARIEAGVVEVQKQPRSLNELMEDAINVVTPAAEAKQIELINDLSPMYLEVLADRDMILQAVINLLSNAVKYTPNAGRVTLRTRMEDNKQAIFEVEDTGVGLNADDCARVFEKFYRVKKDSQMAQGTGLGLPLAKHIVEDVHGGVLVVESEVGRGSIFRAVLPSAGCLTAAKA
jgi:two-component system phosphate regulon sensor histidine kinase PhoR